MRLFGYYICHVFVNNIKKIFKTWIIVLIAIMIVVFGAIGFLAGNAASSLDKDSTVITEEIENNSDGDPLLDYASGKSELILGAVMLLVLFVMMLDLNKGLVVRFVPGDRGILFPSPMKPQSVLFFRLAARMSFIMLISLLYIPMMRSTFGLNVIGCIAFIVAFWGLLIFSMLFQVLESSICSIYKGAKQYIKIILYTIIALIVIGFIVYWRISGLEPFDAVKGYLNSEVSRFVPVWGWLKGIFVFANEGRLLLSGVMLLLMIGLCFVMIKIIWGLNVDFYEEALSKSESYEEKYKEQKVQGVYASFAGNRKRTYSEKIERNGKLGGRGASVFFHKTLYNRFRFAKLKYFTGTTFTYFAVGTLLALLLRLVFKNDNIMIVGLVLTGFVFYRTLGNPMVKDVRSPYFFMVPESVWSKLFFSLAGGTVNSFLDLLPGMIAATIIMGASPLKALLILLFAVTMDYYSTSVNTFINLSVPENVGGGFKQVIQIMFIYFGLIPDVVLILLLFLFGAANPWIIGMIGATVLNLILGFGFFAFTPLMINNGYNC